MFWRDHQHNWMRFTTVGLEFSITFLAGLGLGYWLDTRDRVMPAWMLICGSIGFGAALYRLVRQAQEIRKQDDKPPENSDESR